MIMAKEQFDFRPSEKNQIRKGKRDRFMFETQKSFDERKQKGSQKGCEVDALDRDELYVAMNTEGYRGSLRKAYGKKSMQPTIIFHRHKVERGDGDNDDDSDE